MIVRIMGQGQWVMEPEQLLALNEIDSAVEAAVESGDATALKTALEQLASAVQSHGTQVPDEVLAESDLVLPDVDATVEEVKALLDSTSHYYGLIPDDDTFEPEGDGVDPGVGFVDEHRDGTETTGVEAMGSEEFATEADGETGEVSESNAPQITDAPPTDIDATPEVRDGIDSLEDVPAEDK